MGNNSSKCSLEKTNNDEKSILSDYDITVYNNKREKIFWGTIAICVLYGVIGLLIFLGSYFSEGFKQILLKRFLVFTAVFIVGTIIIVFYLAYQVVAFKPIKIDKTNNYDPLSCPDYWKLEKISIPDDLLIFDPRVNKSLFQYRCVMDDKIFDKGNIAKSDINMKVSNSNGLGDSVSSDASIDLNKPENHLYVNIKNKIESDPNFKNYVKKQNYKPSNLVHHNFIMNNFAVNDVAVNTKTKNIDVKYNYLLDSANPTKISQANTNKIYELNTAVNSNAPYDISTNFKTNNNLKYSLTNVNDVYQHDWKIASSVDGLPSASSITNVPLVCDKVYPLYMSTADSEMTKINHTYDKNINRCAYAKACNISWSDLNCDKYES